MSEKQTNTWQKVSMVEELNTGLLKQNDIASGQNSNRTHANHLHLTMLFLSAISMSSDKIKGLLVVYAVKHATFT